MKKKKALYTYYCGLCGLEYACIDKVCPRCQTKIKKAKIK